MAGGRGYLFTPFFSPVAAALPGNICSFGGELIGKRENIDAYFVGRR